MRKVLILIAIAWLIAITVVHAWLNLRFFDAKRGAGGSSKFGVGFIPVTCHLTCPVTDLMRIWQSEKKTILFVTHDIEETVQVADRVLIMTARSATIQEVVDVDLPRPRHLDSPGYLEKRDRIFQLMGIRLRVGETAA